MNSIEPLQRAVLMCALLAAPGFPRHLRSHVEKFVLHSKVDAPVKAGAGQARPVKVQQAVM
jgi:hypothetical protein